MWNVNKNKCKAIIVSLFVSLKQTFYKADLSQNGTKTFVHAFLFFLKYYNLYLIKQQITKSFGHLNPNPL